jgi:hypothetical protein
MLKVQSKQRIRYFLSPSGMLETPRLQAKRK